MLEGALVKNAVSKDKAMEGDMNSVLWGFKGRKG
jgi:hypothetical protein